MSPVASIDLGTNTVRLIVAEKRPDGFLALYENQLITRLGQGLNTSGRLSREGISRTLRAILQFKKEADRYGAKEIWIAATSAVRTARNSEELTGPVKSETGLLVEVIPWEEEGRRMLRGVSYGLKGKLKRGVVFDIGGGSTEFIETDGVKVLRSAGSSLGVVRLAERHISKYPVSSEELSSLGSEVKESVQRVNRELSLSGKLALTGTAGTVTTIAALDMGLYPYDPEKINGYVIHKTRVEHFIEKIKSRTLPEVLKLPQIERGREDLILPGLITVFQIMEIFSTEEMTVSDFGLREGVLIDRLFPGK